MIPRIVLAAALVGVLAGPIATPAQATELVSPGAPWDSAGSGSSGDGLDGEKQNWTRYGKGPNVPLVDRRYEVPGSPGLVRLEIGSCDWFSVSLADASLVPGRLGSAVSAKVLCDGKLIVACNALGTNLGGVVKAGVPVPCGDRALQVNARSKICEYDVREVNPADAWTITCR